MQEKFAHMLRLQYDLNTLINPEWIALALNETYDYRTAASQEVGEAMESLGYAWWTSRDLDMQNVLTELVDAMHFILSYHIATTASSCSSPEEVFDLLSLRLNLRLNIRYSKIEQQKEMNVVEVRALIRNLQAQINVGQAGDMWEAFFEVAKAVGFNFDLIYARYVAKNILNTFRQDNGYRQRQYHKVWYDGREDNSHVADYVDNLILTRKEDFNPDAFSSWLKSEYAKNTKPPAVETKPTAVKDVEQPNKEQGQDTETEPKPESEPNKTQVSPTPRRR